jgi:hypothetical protein
MRIVLQMQHFNIKPLLSVGPVRFGLEPSEVEGLLGPAVSATKNRDGEREERRDGITVRYGAESGKVAEVAFGPEVVVTIDGLSILEADDPVRELAARSRDVVECLGFIVFLDLGLTLTGYHDDAPEQRALTAFAPGHWDSMRSHFVRFGAGTPERGQLT